MRTRKSKKMKPREDGSHPAPLRVKVERTGSVGSVTTWTKTRPTIPGVYLYRQKSDGRWTEPMRMTIASNGTGLCDDFAVLNPEDAEWLVEETPAWTKTPPSARSEP